MTYIPPKKINYLSNKEILKEINESKKTFCHFIDKKYEDYDIIVENTDEITSEIIEKALQTRKRRLDQKNEPTSAMDIVIRRITNEHIPVCPIREAKAETKINKDTKVKTNFAAFKHYFIDSMDIINTDIEQEDDSGVITITTVPKYSNVVLKEGGRSHWADGLENGCFVGEKGRISNRLALMFMKLVDKYGQRSNWRNYCVDEQTEALTKRGWLNIDEINDKDTILSYENGQLKWSKIKSVFKGEHNDKMFKLTVAGMDALVTPRHKFVTDSGLKLVDHLLEKDRIILTGEPVEDGTGEFSDSFVELMGWVVTEGNYYNDKNRNYTRISISQNEGEYANRIRNCLNNVGAKFSETHRKQNGKTLVCFILTKDICQRITNVSKDKNLTIEFILALTQNQRNLLIETMVDADGWRTKTYLRYGQKDKRHVDMFLALCTLAGRRLSFRQNDIISYGKPTKIWQINIYTKRKNVTQVENINFHGGKVKNTAIGKGKIHHPNIPTVDYNGRIWCPETEFGSFMARRNGTIYLTGNSYLDEMKAQALLQLSMVGLQFDEHRSENPFAYYTTIITTSFTRILNTEKKNQNLRDDLLEQAGEVSSSTRQLDHESTEAQARDFALTLTDEDDLISASEQHYDLHTRRISAKKEDFVKAVLAHYNHNNK